LKINILSVATFTTAFGVFHTGTPYPLLPPLYEILL
jgi:hypothetical protein